MTARWRTPMTMMLLLVATALPAPAADRVVEKTSPPLAAATLTVWSRQIVVFRAQLRQVGPADRAARAAGRIAALPAGLTAETVQAETATVGEVRGMLVYAGNHMLFAILPDDVDPSTGETLQSVTAHALAELREVLRARAEQRRVPVLLRGAALAIGAAVLVVLFLWGIGRITESVLHRLDAAVQARATRLVGVDVGPLLYAFERWLVRLVAWAMYLAVIYLWLTFVLYQLPYTRPLGHRLGAYVLDILHELVARALQAVPGIFAVVVIFAATRFAVRLAGMFFRAVERGTVVVRALQPDTVGATRHITVALMWIFALTVAYQYIPGSDSDAFKAIGVFTGLMISLGSAGLVSQFMSGLVTIYARALRPGELVRTGDVVGVVSHVGLLSTKVTTATREEVTIPNSVLAGMMVTNYSRLAGETGAVVATTVTIGYDVPWRQVHALLLTAAERTPGALTSPEPHVLQRALSDFAVQYELRVGIDRVEERFRILSQLHGQIQDAFNEVGVQIMSPHFEAQPHQPVVVPPSRWYEPPAVPAHSHPEGRSR